MEGYIYSVITDLPIMALLVVIAISLYVLSKGADILVNEAVGLSLHWGISEMIIGATIVSLGTTLPEATVSVAAALSGNSDMALGNAIGSIITNTTLVIGVAAIIGKLAIDKNFTKKHGKVHIMSIILLAFVGLPFFSSGASGRISQVMGFVFLILLGVYTWGMINDSKESELEVPREMKEESSPMILQMLKLILGIVLIIISSKVLIPSVEITALSIGIPQSIIAATLVAFGTSLPELVTAITAVRRGHGELAIGNVIGANILNVLLVVGTSASVTRAGLFVPRHFYKLQIPTMIIVLIAFYIFTNNKDDHITKWEGFSLLGMYLVYLVLNYVWI